MSKFKGHFSAATAAVLGLAVAGFAASGHAGSTDGAVQCGIEATTANGIISLQAVVLAKTPVAGAYSFAVASQGPGGKSNISQGGRFAAGANEPVALGRASFNSNAQYQVIFEVTANGVELDCAAPLSRG